MKYKNIEGVIVKEIDVSRRRFFKRSLVVSGVVVTSTAIAESCLEDKTAKQPLGPYFPNDQTPKSPVRENQDPALPVFLANDNDLSFVKGRKGRAKGQEVYIRGKVLDNECNPVVGAHVIIWQANSKGGYNHVGDSQNLSFDHPLTGETIVREHDPFFQYWGKSKTDRTGSYSFKTIVPGFYPANLESGWYRPPHIHFMVTSVGKPQFVTQMYFRGELIENNQFIQKLNDKDFLLQNKEMTQKEKEALIVDFFEDGQKNQIGTFDIVI